MSPADAVWYLGETHRNPMTISSVLWLDGPLDVTSLRRRIEERVLMRHPVFQQRIVPARLPGLLPTWRQVEAFDLDEHVRVIELPPPGEHALLEARCSIERSTPLDRDRPLWSISVYQGYRGTGTAMHVRFHHSIGDGIALMRLLLTLCDEYEPGSVPLADAPPHPLAHELRAFGHHAVAMASQHAMHPGRIVTTARQAVSTAGWATRLFLPSLVEQNVLHGLPHGVKRMTWDPDGYPVADLKAVGRAMGVTVNDVLLTIAAGGLHRYLAERDALVDDVVVMIPIDLRDPAAPLPRRLGNRIGLLPVRLPVRSPDPEQRLAVLHARMQELKDSPAPWISQGLLVGTSLVTPTIERGLHRFNQMRSTGVITNVPGPAGPMHIAGARVVGAVGWGGMTGHLNLSAAFISLNGRVFPGLVTDTAITDDPDRLLAHLRDEWDAVITALAPAAVPATPSPGKR